jgi:hypothetical protein
MGVAGRRPKWIVKSTAGKISRIETRARLVKAGGLDAPSIDAVPG